MPKAKVAALVFDLGGVIVAHDNPVMARRLASRCHQGWGAADVGRLASERRWGVGAPIADLHAAMRAQGGYDGSWDQFKEDWCCHLSLDFAMLDYVERLAARHRVMIFSNTNAVHWNFLVAASQGRLGAFETHLSHELGLQKPEPDSYARVAARARLAPESLLFFDDLPANVEGARQAGFQAEVFTSRQDLQQDLACRSLAGA